MKFFEVLAHRYPRESALEVTMRMRDSDIQSTIHSEATTLGINASELMLDRPRVDAMIKATLEGLMFVYDAPLQNFVNEAIVVKVPRDRLSSALSALKTGEGLQASIKKQVVGIKGG